MFSIVLIPSGEVRIHDGHAFEARRRSIIFTFVVKLFIYVIYIFDPCLI